MSIWVSIPNQSSMKYDIYSSIEQWHCEWAANARYTCTKSDRIYKYSHYIEFTFLVYIYIFSVVCVALHNTIMWQDFWTTSNINCLNCLTFYSFRMLTGKEFQTEAPENVNEWRNIMSWSGYVQMICWGRPKKPWIDFRCKNKICCKITRSSFRTCHPR